MRWTFPLFRIFGIPIRMHWLLAILIAGRILHGVSRDGLWGLQWVSITMAILLISILFHELSHCWMGIRLGGHAEQILLWPLGGLARIDHTGTPRDQIRISGIGPISSFVLGGLCAGGLLLTGAAWHWSYLNPWAPWWPAELLLIGPDGVPSTGFLYYLRGFLLHSVKLNLMLGLFNLCVPAYPLDGGQVVFSFLQIKYGKLRAAQTSATLGIIIGLAMAVWGIAQEELNLILIGAWVLIEAFQLRYLVRIGDLEAHPAFGHQAAEFDYMPDRPKKKGWFARWKARRAQARAVREMEQDARDRDRVDAVLEKVGREGMGSLTAAEKKVLEDASRKKQEGR